VPSLVDSGLLNGVRQLAVSGNSNCALRDDGRVLCWGNNGKGALGTNINFNTANPNPVPTLIDNLVLGTVRQLALGSGSHNCALREDGRVLCWGNNYSGQLGIAINVQSTEGYPIPTVVDQDELGVVQQIALGGFHTCALRNDGRVLCWGLNTSGQLGVNTNLGASTANTVPALVDNSALGFVRQLALGSDHSCALRDDGRVLCWGSTLRGKLGNSNNAATDTPDPEPTLIDNSALGIVQQVAVGTDHSCALREDGRVLCWGGNSRGQLGNSVNIGTVTPNPAPTLVDNGELGTVRRLAIGDFHSCALRDDGRVLCWGSNLNGILGSAPNDTGVDSRNPVPTLVGGLPPLAPSSSPLSRALFSQTISRTTMYAFRSPAQLRKAA
jgi:alpha-tubulin suppressor-like RCC1 family protein